MPQDDRLILDWEKPDMDEADLAATKKPPFVCVRPVPPKPRPTNPRTSILLLAIATLVLVALVTIGEFLA